MAILTRKGEKVDIKYNFKQYFNLLSKYKWAALLIMFLAILHEARKLAEKLIYKVIIDKGTEYAAGIVALEVFVSILITMAIIFAVISILDFIFIWFKENNLIRLTTNMMQDLKIKFFNHVLGLHHDFHTTHKTGSMISRLLRGGWTIDRMNDTLLYQFAPLAINMVLVVGALVYFDLISAIIVIGVSITFISYGFYIQKIQQEANLLAIKAEDLEKANVSDFFTNVDSIKYYGKEKRINRRYKEITDESKLAARTHWNYFRLYGSVLSIILAVGTFLLIYFSLERFLAGEITLGTLVFIYTAYLGLMGPMWMFNNGVRNFYRSMADFQDLFYYGKIQNEVKDKQGAKNLDIQKGTIEFKNVDFSYGKRKIFKNFNLKIKENEKVALVGHSGCGKTTLIKILNRFYDVEKGAILIDDCDIRDFKQESVRGETGIVPQECILFDDTLYNNIKFADPNSSRQEVMNAMKFAQLDEIIVNFPNKENTIVGERGVRLSGGEKQRVSVARAILANKKILVLDEATSSLDSETEHEIQKDLQKLLEGRTSIIIAHRLSTIMNADRIIVMKEGKIIQQGKHFELIKQPGEYKKLWNLQKGGYIK